MSKVVLFSPVGGTDPISENNYYDGSLLHICCTFADGTNQMRSISTYLKKYLTTKIKTIEWLEP